MCIRDSLKPMTDVITSNPRDDHPQISNSNTMKSGSITSTLGAKRIINDQISSNAVNSERPSMPVMHSRELILNEARRDSLTPNNNQDEKNDANNTFDNDTKIIATKSEIQSSNTNSTDNDQDQSQIPTKTDFFAAKLASAVGDNEISDSEETFVYESAANSTKNMILPSTMEAIQQQQQQQQPVSYTHLDVYKRQLSRLRNIASCRRKLVN